MGSAITENILYDIVNKHQVAGLRPVIARLMMPPPWALWEFVPVLSLAELRGAALLKKPFYFIYSRIDFVCLLAKSASSVHELSSRSPALTFSARIRPGRFYSRNRRPLRLTSREIYLPLDEPSATPTRLRFATR